MLIETASTLLIYMAFLAFAAKRLLTYLHIFQQEEYDEGRFLGWMFGRFVMDKRMTIILIIAGVGWFFDDLTRTLPDLLVFAGFCVLAYKEKDPRQTSKKKLAMTSRAQRIFTVAMCLSVLSGSWVFFTQMPLLWVLPVHMLPIFLVLANIMLAPYEMTTQKKFWNEAHDKLKRLRPTVIGITGSYGKTSIKHILGHILQSAAPTLVTPGSVNTPMGISRIIREELEERHKYFIVEMGAYGPGSIARLCKLAPPDVGIISAVGHAHYERFRSLEAVARTKYELAQAVLENSGDVIVHEKTLGFPYTKAIHDSKKNSFIVCGKEHGNTLEIKEANQNSKGLEVLINFRNTTFLLEAPLYGLHHAQNMALAFAAARALDIPTKQIVTAMKSTPQIPHRLEVKKQPGGGALIDDAYNSNPVGFRSALDLLAVISPDKRKILITPGMVELGSIHDDVHEKLGLYAGEICDAAVIVNPKRIPTFIKGFKEKGNGKILAEVKTFSEAQVWLQKNRKDGDIVLIENDLPDLYENTPRI